MAASRLDAVGSRHRREGIGHSQSFIGVEDQCVGLVETGPDGTGLFDAHSCPLRDLFDARRPPQLDEQTVGRLSDRQV